MTMKPRLGPSKLLAKETKWTNLSKRLFPVKKTSNNRYHPPQPDNNILAKTRTLSVKVDYSRIFSRLNNTEDY